MPALFFPNLDALRLVLASGVVPREVSAAPARAGFDAHGRVWLEPLALPPRGTLAGLSRFGVQALGGGEARTDGVGCWAELLPLRPVARGRMLEAGPLSARVLFELTDSDAAGFVRSLVRYGRSAVGVQLLPDDGRAWATCDAPPAAVLLRCADADSTIEAFTEQAAGVWVRVGWEHPLPEHLTVPDGSVLLLRPGHPVVARPDPVPEPAIPEYALVRVRGTRVASGVTPDIPVRLTLKSAPDTPRETVWVLSVGPAADFWEWCRSAGERLVRQFEAATVGEVGAECVIVRPAAGRRSAPSFPLPVGGYYPDARVAGLFLPAGHTLRPAIRPHELTRLFALTPDRLTWVERDRDGNAVPHTVPVSAFRPVSELLEYAAPAAVALPAVAARADLFPLGKFTLAAAADEVALLTDPGGPTRLPAPSATETEAPGQPGWLSRSLGRLTDRFRKSAPSPGAAPTRTRTKAVEKESAYPKAVRVEEKLASADALLHGHDRAARRQELEARLLDTFPRLGPGERAAGWADLAAVYAATANPADAAVCWVNAVWEADPPPDHWLEQWYLAECRAARQPAPATLDRWLGEPGRPGAARVVAAYTAWAGRRNPTPPDVVAALPRVLALLDQHFDDLPARAAWLARAAAARLCDGDALGLARWRDRVLARLRDKGPGLDLDAPSFLRFHGTASPDRFQTARDWLARTRKPVLDWVGKAGRGGRLQWAGLDAETDCTAAYAQLMLAWGLGCLGERTRARDWAGRARKVLARAGGPGVDPDVHAVLGDLFAHRIRDVQDGRPAGPGLPPDLAARVEHLPAFSRYAVDRLRDHCRILEPVGPGRAFRGLDLRGFRGHDLLGERLHVLADRSDPAHLADEARQLLAVIAAEPSSATVPRITLTLLDLAPHLDAPTVRDVLPHVVPAASWLETWLQAGRWTDAERADRLPKYLARLMTGALAAASAADLYPAARPLVDYLLRHAGPDAALRAAVSRSAGAVFRSLRKLGYRSEAEELLHTLDPANGHTPADAPFPPSRLGLAVGWFAAGDEDAGNRILNDARRRLFVAREGDDRGRTALAIAYAEALGAAPPRVALGRLEEIFQLLDRVTTTGSTNRYYTLKPLQLIDAVVRSVVTEEFALGPAVRGWLDDDEFVIRNRIHRDMTDVLRDGRLG